MAPRLTERDGIRAALIAMAKALQQDPAEAGSLAAEAARGARAAKDMVLGPQVLGTVANVYMMTGDHEAAASILRELASIPAQRPSVAILELDPVMAGFRGSPEFPAVLAAFEAVEAEAARMDAEAGY
jgi:hypothetical protein